MRVGQRRARSLRPEALASARFDRYARERGLVAELWRDGFAWVTSSSGPQRHLVSFDATDSGLALFACDCSVAAGGTSPTWAMPGQTCCSHAAAVADLLEARHVALWDGTAWRSRHVLPR